MRAGAGLACAGVFLAACGASHNRSTAGHGAASIRIRGASLVAGRLNLTLTDGSRRLLELPASVTLEGLADLDGDGSPEVLIQLGEGASTVLSGIVSLDSGSRAIQVLAPAGEPGAGDPWQLSAGASATSASGYRCGPPALVLLHSEQTAPGRAMVTTRSYLLRAGVAQPTGPAESSEVPADGALARSSGTAMCSVTRG